MTSGSPHRSNHAPIIIVALTLLLLATVVIVGGAAYLWLNRAATDASQAESAGATPLPTLAPRATAAPMSEAPPTATSAATATLLPSPTAVLTPTPSPEPTLSLAEQLAVATMPAADPVALAESVDPNVEIPRVVYAAPTPLAVGARRTFWVSDMDDESTYAISATLRVQTNHVQMWVADDAEVDKAALARSAAVFDSDIYPTDRKLFGSEWTPGVDSDTHLIVLNAPFRGAAGYFSGVNEYSRLVHPYSNECEMFFMSTLSLQPGTADYNGTLAHEFQHMIHWYTDINEETWVNEGASTLAEDLNGYGYDRYAVEMFANQPDLQLNTWSSEDPEMGAHYGASYLFMRYLADRFGTDPITAIVQSPANGIDGIDAVLQEEGSSFETIFGDWVAANAIGDTSVGDGRYGYQTADINPAPDRRIDQYPTNYSAGVNQYGTDYVVLEPEEGLQGELQLIFHGRPSVQLLPTEPTSGQDLWWSNRGDAGYSYLEREFDLTDVSQAALDYNLWYEIEDGWDYAYVRVSTDGGQTWAFLRGAHMTDDNPVGNALGVGYTGYSGLSGDTSGGDAEWVNESLDLTPYCGGKVLLRFEYVTDDAVNEPGLCLDDLRLDAIGFADDAESDAGWTASGFIRNDNRLTQGYLVQAITYTTTGNVEVQRIAVDASGRGELNVDGLGGQVQQVVLTISGLAPVTTERATYALDLKLLDETPGESALLGGQDGT